MILITMKIFKYYFAVIVIWMKSSLSIFLFILLRMSKYITETLDQNCQYYSRQRRTAYLCRCKIISVEWKFPNTTEWKHFIRIRPSNLFKTNVLLHNITLIETVKVKWFILRKVRCHDDERQKHVPYSE